MRHDASDFPLQQVPFPGHTTEVLSIDHNFMVNQSKVTSGDPAKFAQWKAEVEGAYLGGFQRAHDGNRVSFRQLCDWLDAQEPAGVAKLQKLPVGKAPSAGWASFVT